MTARQIDVVIDGDKLYATMQLVLVRKVNGLGAVEVRTTEKEWLGNLKPRALPKWLLEAMRNA